MRAGVMALIALILCGTATASGGSPTGRAFVLGAGREVRVFTLRERSGVILLNRLTVPVGMRVVVDAGIPTVSLARVATWGRRGPATSCSRRGALEVCTQREEWCPMPKAIWHVRLVKQAGPAGLVRFDFVVAPPPR